jgi:hypothetical protein
MISAKKKMITHKSQLNPIYKFVTR